MNRTIAVAVLAAGLFATSALAQDAAPPPLPTGAAEAEPPPPPPPLVDAPATAAPAPAAEPRSGAPAQSPTGGDAGDGAAPVKRRLQRITGGPLSVLVGAVTLEYERALSEKLSFFVGPRIGYFGLGVGASTGVRFFPLSGDIAPVRGLWIGPELFTEFRSRSGTQNGVSYAGTGLTGILLGMVGYTYTGESGWTISIGTGLGGGWNQESGTTLVIDPNTFQPRVQPSNGGGPIFSLASHLNVGWAF